MWRLMEGLTRRISLYCCRQAQMPSWARHRYSGRIYRSPQQSMSSSARLGNKKNGRSRFFLHRLKPQAVFTKVRIHFVQSVFFTFWPFSIMVICCKLGLNERLVARNEKLRLWPNVVVFPHDSHFAIRKSFPYITSFLGKIEFKVHHCTGQDSIIDRIFLQETML